jgi:hypothetical protein
MEVLERVLEWKPTRTELVGPGKKEGCSRSCCSCGPPPSGVVGLLCTSVRSMSIVNVRGGQGQGEEETV